jgi:uncharacterized protein (TIGR03118 family)
MSFHSWLQDLRSALAPGKVHRRRPRRSAKHRPHLEVLEDRTVPSGFQQINLVSNQPGLGHFTDSNLNGWGMAGMPDGSFVVANAFTTGLATFYDRSGHVLPQTITVPVEAAESQFLHDNVNSNISTIYGHPTGVVYNPTNDFWITNPATGVRAPATLIFDTLDGTICGWNPVVDPTHAIVLYDSLADNNGTPAVYTSLDIGQSGGQNVLYATDFLHNQLEIIGPDQTPGGTLTNFTNIDCTGLGVSNKLNPSVTTDPNSSVWSASVVNGQLIVTFADLFGPVTGGGAVDVFNTDGGFLYQIDANDPTSSVAATATGRLENPWGVTLAPAKFGMYSNDLLVGNVWGPGHINAYQPDSNGSYTIYAGQLQQPNGAPIAIKGLWDLEFGDGTPDSGKTNQLFFDAGPNHPGDSTGGLFGVIHAAGDQGGGAPVREAAAPSKPVQQRLTRPQLQPVVQQALVDWQSAGATAAQLAQLRQVSVSIQALPGLYLGEEAGNQVWISPDAAGWGWNLGARAPTGRMDLRSVLDREFGHVLGLEDSDNRQDVMGETLAVGNKSVALAPTAGPPWTW